MKNKYIVLTACGLILAGALVIVAVAHRQAAQLTDKVIVTPENINNGAFTDNTNQAVNITVADTKIISPKGGIVVRRGVTVHMRIADSQDPEEVDIRIPAFGQNTTFSQNSEGDFDFMVDKTGRFPIYLQREDDDQFVAGYLVVQ